jgi:hypothetical protein
MNTVRAKGDYRRVFSRNESGVLTGPTSVRCTCATEEAMSVVACCAVSAHPDRHG